MKKKTRTIVKKKKKTKKVSKPSSRIKKAAAKETPSAAPLKEDKVFLKKMLENIFPQITEQIMSKALKVSQQLRRRRGPRS